MTEAQQRAKALKNLEKAMIQIDGASTLLQNITSDLKVPIILGATWGKLKEVMKIIKKDQSR